MSARNARAVAAGALIIVATLVAATTASAATADGSYSIQKNGKWYWSTDLADGIYLPYTGIPGRGADIEALLRDLPLTRDQKLPLEAGLAKNGPFVGTTIWKPDWKDGTTVFKWTCRGTGASIPSPNVATDLYHQFRCQMAGATFKRVAGFQQAVHDARQAILSASQPVPQPLIDKLAQAYANLGVYQLNGDPVHRTITAVVDGRRNVGLVGVEPIS
jgi:hypothetical protein